MFDEGRRLRLFSYLGYVVTRETRLALWSVAPPHPSFTPLWMLTLLAGPMLLFTFLRIELRSRATAMTGVAVYLVSVGYLSGATMLFHAGKPLANVVVIATLLLSAHINSRMQRRPFEDGIAPAPPRLLWFGLLGLLTVAPFVDETAVFAYAIPLVWCPSVFWPRRWPGRAGLGYVRNWAVYLIPACLVALVIVVILPGVAAAPGRPFDLLEYLRSAAAEGAHTFDARRIAWQAGNLAIPGLLPWDIATC